MVRTLTFLLLLAVTAFAADPNRASNLVILDKVSVNNLRLETVETEERAFEETLFALGRIKVAPGHRAVVSSRIAGRALTVSAQVDTKIEKGAEAVVMESRQPGDPPPSIRLVAPISGLISAVNIVPGQPITADNSLIEIIDLSEVHAVAAVPEHFAGRVRVGQKARIRAAGFPDKEFEAEVEHLGAEADAETDTIEVAFHVANPELILRPGMRVEFTIIASSRADVVSIPKESVQGDAGRAFVYIADYELPNAFMKTPVELGAQNDRFVEVLGGVLPGDKVVTRGSYALGFAGKGSISLREALDAAHGHPHGDNGSELSADQIAAKKNGGASGTGQAFRFTPLITLLVGSNAVLIVLLGLSLVYRKRSA